MRGYVHFSDLIGEREQEAKEGKVKGRVEKGRGNMEERDRVVCSVWNVKQ